MKTKHLCRRALAMLLVILSVMSMFSTTAFAGQEDGYHDPAERWMNASNRTNELDVNATVTHETFYCYSCGQQTSFRVWRTPEYTKDGQTAMTRNVRYSDGTLISGTGTGTILDGTPGVNATYTGYHWTKSCCENCGTMNANMGVSDYSFSKNVYWLYDCATAFTEYLDDVVTYEYADPTYHLKRVDGGSYCEFCYGTRHTHSEALERHTLHTDIIPQLGHQRFAVVTHCEKCDYADYEFVAAKAVVADYYGVVDGQAHTITVTDLSESGVNAVIRYGNRADACTMTAPPSYTDKGEYTVYYAVTYTYQGVSMEENGVAYVWLRDESLPELEGCPCGCGDPDCDCKHGTCPHCLQFDCTRGIHNFIFIDTVRPTCTTLGYDRWLCPICGLIENRNYVNATGHTWQSVVVREADCEHSGKVLDICQSCGETRVTETAKGEHTWQTNTVAATCTSPSYTVSECSRCGERRITNIGAVLGHSYQSYVTPATCVTGGMTLHICDRCGQSYADNYTEAKGHRWNTGEVVTAPTCVSEGVKEYTCEACGVSKSEAIPAADHKPGPAATCTEAQLCTVCGAVLAQPTGHNYTETVAAPTCERMGYTTYTCVNCGASYRGDYTDALGHSYTAVVTAPTCTEMGYTTYTCSRCHDSYIDHYLPALGHDWDQGTVIASSTCNGAGVVEHRCTRCDASYLEAIDAAGHKAGLAATCTDAQLCTVCGAVIAPAEGHRYAATVTKPTCKTMGYTTYVCKDCDDSYRGDYTDALGHNYVAAVTPATCLTDGYTTCTCSRCGDSYTADRVPALGHCYDAGTVLVKPSCTTDGIRVYACEGCGHEHSEAVPATGHTPGPAATCTEPQSCTVCGAILSAAHGHAYKTERTAAGCETMGYTTYTCEICGMSYRADYTDALGHSYAAVVTAPTCTEPGYTTYTCTRCGASYTDSYTAPKGHRWDRGKALTDATCTGEGVTVYRCRDCDAAFLWAVSATGHTPGEPATCTEPQLCSVCGAILAPAKGHRYTATVTEPTCKTMGYTTYVCADCGDTYRAEYVDALGHSFESVVTEPTCTEAGYTTWTCSRCGESFVTDRREPAGHVWDDGTIIVKPSCTGEGFVEYRCTACDKTRSETLPALGHVPGEPATCTEPQLCVVCGAVLANAHGHSYATETVDPTCEQMGFTFYTCSFCGERYKADYTDPIGHAYVAEVTEPTCTEAGYTTWTCANCGDSYVDGHTEPLGHDWDEGTAITDATCNGKGVLEYRCRRCNETDLEAVDATGHVPGDPATCTEPQLCVACGAVLEKAHGHSFEAEVTAPTCLRMGYTTYTCAECGETYRGDYTDPTGHDYDSYVTEPSCTEGGYTTYYCVNCNDSFSVRFTPPLGHDWIGTVIAEPCCTGDGVMEYTCSRCGEKQIEKIPATGHIPGSPATCTNPQICLDCGAVLAFAKGHDFRAVTTPATCLKMGWTTYTCAACGESYRSDYIDALGHDYVPTVTEPTCTLQGYTTWTCSRCGEAFVTDYVDPLGHEWDEGTKLISTSCNGEGLVDHRCVRCDYHYLEALSPVGHTPGAEADCIHPQICTVCGAVLVQAKGHSYEAVVTAPTCTEMGYTTYTCTGCGESYKSDYTKANGHKEGDWIIDKEPTTEAEGQRHKVCTVCGETLITETIEKLYNMATTDSKGEAVVGGYLVIVTDTDTKNPVAGATVILNRDSSISIRLPDGRLLDYADQTTVTVRLTKDKTPVKDLQIVVTDRNGNYSAEKTDANGQITVPGITGVTGPDGIVTFGWIDADGNRYTITIRISDYENGRPIIGAVVSIGKTGHITVTLPKGIDMDAANRIVLVLTNQHKAPMVSWTIIVKGDRASETGETDEDGTLIVPEIIRQEKHTAYIVGYPDGTFGPERSMTRAEATAIFARLLADKKGDTIVPVKNTKFEDIPENAWYSGYARYLNNYGVVYGTEDGMFSPDRPITRAEFVAMAVRFFEVYGDGNPTIMEQYAEFNDVSDGYWAAQYIKDAAIYGWIRGYGDGTFRAAQEITRAEVVTIVNRLLGRTADEAYVSGHLRDLNIFSDMTEQHWAYLAVMEAANAHTATYDKGESWKK